MKPEHSPAAFRRKTNKYAFAILLTGTLLLTLLCGCSSQKPQETSAAVQSEDFSEETAAETEAPEPSPEIETEEETAESTRAEILPGDPLAAYRLYVPVLEEYLESAEQDGDTPVQAAALCDIALDTAPELFYLTEGSADEAPCLHIVSAGEDGLQEILKDENTAFQAEYEGQYCFFTLSGDRMLYEYSSSTVEGERTAGWYYYKMSADGLLERQELAACRGGGTAFFYMMQETSEENYRQLVETLLGRMQNILLCSPGDVFSGELSDRSDTALDYSMSAAEAVDFMNSELNKLPDDRSYESMLADFIGKERYLLNEDAEYRAEEPLQFGLYDLDADGVAELFITNGATRFTDRTVHVYGFEDGAFRYLGDAGFRECLLYTAPGTDYPGVFCEGGDSGFIMEYYYTLEEDGSIHSELVASFEDTTFKVESHDDQVVTEDPGLYEAWVNARPTEENPGHLVLKFTAEDLESGGVELLLEAAGIQE